MAKTALLAFFMTRKTDTNLEAKPVLDILSSDPGSTTPGTIVGGAD
jgi:hypothetical protein